MRYTIDGARAGFRASCSKVRFDWLRTDGPVAVSRSQWTPVSMRDAASQLTCATDTARVDVVPTLDKESIGLTNWSRPAAPDLRSDASIMTTFSLKRSGSVALLALMLIVPAYAAETGAPARAAAPAASPTPAAAAANTKALDNLLAAQTAADQAGKTAQDQIDQLDDSTQQMASKYSRALELTASVNKYNAHLQEQVAAQRTELKSIEAQLATIETTSRDVFPLMEKMVDMLAQFVAADMPFKIDERTKRVETLKGLMDRADVSV